MKIDFTKNNDTMCVTVEGRLDTVTAPELEKFFGSNLVGVSALVLDCQNLAYVSSAGLRVILGAHKRMKGSMKLTNVCELVMEVFEMTGFADILVIE